MPIWHSAVKAFYVELCFQELPEAMPAAKCCAYNSTKLLIVPEATQLAVVATVYQGTVLYTN